MAIILLNNGEGIIVQLADTDGSVTVSFGEAGFVVHADLPDTAGRVGTIYHELLAADTDFAKLPYDPIGPGSRAWEASDVAINFLAVTKIALFEAGKAEHDFDAWVGVMLGKVDQRIRDIWADQRVADPAPESEALRAILSGNEQV